MTATKTAPVPARLRLQPRAGSKVTGLAGLALIAALLPARHVWVAAILLLILSLTVPGILALRAMRVHASVVERYPIYVPAASLMVLMAAGFAADLLGPSLGVARPLSGDTTVVATLALSFVLWLAGLRVDEPLVMPWSTLFRSPATLAPLVLPAFAAAGAMLLTNGRGAVLADVVAVAVPLVLLVTCWKAGRIGTASTAMLLFSCALAAEWAFSLPSQATVGFDISAELHIAQLTNANGIWHTVHHGDPYSAMLSLTVLPSVIKALTGISPLITFKVVYPVIAALLPVSIFLIGKRFLRRPYAAGAAAILIAQTYFVQQLPELARQEIGLLFFAALIAALIEDRARRGPRYGLILMFAAGLVVSHYSSTYVAIAVLAFALPVELIVERRRAFKAVLLPIVVALAVLGAGAGVWYGAVTRSASNVSGFTSSLMKEGLDLLPTSAGGIVNSYLNGNLSASVSPAQYQTLAVKNFATRRAYIHPLPEARERRFDLKASQIPAEAQRLAPLASAFRVLDTVIDELLLLIAGIGALLAICSRNRGLRNLGVLASGTVGMLVLFRFSGTLGSAYNQTRALLQAWLLLAIPAAYLLQTLIQRAPRWLFPSVLAAGIAAAMPFMFAYGNGTLLLVTGGSKLLNLSQSGTDFETFYQFPAEMTAATWVSAESRGRLVYADRYGQLRLDATTGVVSLPQLTPRTLDDHAWVLGTRTNIVLRRTRGVVENYTSTYEWPSAFLNSYFDTVFTDGISRVYHR